MQTPSSDDILQVLQNTLPTGAAWPREPGTIQYLLLQALADAQALTTGDEANLLVDAFPATSVELLPEWEATLGLPDPCLGTSPTLAQRQASVVARLVAQGGQSIPYLEQYAASLGYENTTFTEFTPFRVGMTVGQPLYGPAWAFALQVNSPNFQETFFRVGINETGDALATWNNQPLECELSRVAPGHVVLIFNFYSVGG